MTGRAASTAGDLKGRNHGKEANMLKYQVAMQAGWNRLRTRLVDDEGASLVETLVWAGAIAVAAVGIVALIQAWGTAKVNALP